VPCWLPRKMFSMLVRWRYQFSTVAALARCGHVEVGELSRIREFSPYVARGYVELTSLWWIFDQFRRRRLG
jgi:hypothetical protein